MSPVDLSYVSYVWSFNLFLASVLGVVALVAIGFIVWYVAHEPSHCDLSDLLFMVVIFVVVGCLVGEIFTSRVMLFTARAPEAYMLYEGPQPNPYQIQMRNSTQPDKGQGKGGPDKAEPEVSQGKVEPSQPDR